MSSMRWPAHIVQKSSRLLDTETIENKFYPLYDDILNECFPRTTFSISPQYATPMAQTGGVGAIDFAITYVIEALDIDSPVLFIEVKPPIHLPVISARKEAENQVRRRFGEISHLVKIPKLYGISAIGRQLSYYEYNKASGRIVPDALPDSSAIVMDTAPVERWNTNIMEPEGYDTFVRIVEEVKRMTFALWWVYPFVV
jgi:hypothetical protein